MSKKTSKKNISEDLVEKAKTIWDMYEKGIEYQRMSKLSKTIPTCVKFYEGDQWPAPTERTKTLPRPVINITKMIVRNKKAGILSQKTQFVYSCNDTEKAKQFNDFSNYICKEMNHDKLDRKAVDDGAIKGTYVYHYYWDADAVGKHGNLPGGVRCELIDPLCFIPENPTNDDEQAQKWIIIRTRLNIETVKSMCDKGVDKSLIGADDNESPYKEEEQDKENKVTVLTRYFRKDGVVYFEKATRSTIIVKARPLHPDLKSASKSLKEDEANEEGYEVPEEETNTSVAHLYPIAVGSYDKRDKSIFGIGEVEGIIPNQKAINFNFAIQLYNVQNVWGTKYIALPNALRGQKITNDPGQLLIDYSGTGNGIKKMAEQMTNDVPIKVSDTLMGATRVVTGATEVMTGETIGANTSGAAILQLQSQALKPIEELQQSFWNTQVKCGKILEMFFKLYYEDTTYYYKEKDDNGVESQERKAAVFNGSDFADTDFEVSVEVIAGTKGSEVSLVNALDNLLQQKQIDLKTYFELYPHNALPNKNQILADITKREKEEIFRLQAQNQEYERQLQNAASIFEQEKQTIQNAVNVIKEKENLEKMIVNLRAEFTNKIKAVNEQVQLGNAKIQELNSDAIKLAQGWRSAIDSKRNNQGQV